MNKKGSIKVAQDTPAFVRLENYEGQRHTKTFLTLVYVPLCEELSIDERGYYNPSRDEWHVRKNTWPHALDNEVKKAIETVSKEDELNVVYQVNKFCVDQDLSLTTVSIFFSTMQPVPVPLNYARSLKMRIQKFLR